MRDFTQLLKNKFRSKRYFGGHAGPGGGVPSSGGTAGRRTPKLGYLPVSSSSDRPGSAMDGIDPYAAYAASLASAAVGSPQRSISRQDMTDLDAVSVAGVSDGGGSGSSARVTPLQHTEPTRRQMQQQQQGENGGGNFADEHSLIAQYCAKLLNGDYTTVVPDSPMQVMAEINKEQTAELELMIKELESENATLQEEYQHLKASTAAVAVASTTSPSSGCGTATTNNSSSSSTSQPQHSAAAGGTSDVEILNEAKLLREHKERLESRMRILEEHNQQLVSQLGKLKVFMGEPATNGTSAATNASGHLSLGGQSGPSGTLLCMMPASRTGTLNTKAVTASQLATNSPVMTHKVYPPNALVGGDPPALPPRASGVRQGQTDRPAPPAVPPKRSSLTRSDLGLFNSEQVRFQLIISIVQRNS